MICVFFVLSIFSQVRLESIEAVNNILEEANKRIQPAGTGNVNNWDNFDDYYFLLL